MPKQTAPAAALDAALAAMRKANASQLAALDGLEEAIHQPGATKAELRMAAQECINAARGTIESTAGLITAVARSRDISRRSDATAEAMQRLAQAATTELERSHDLMARMAGTHGGKAN